MIKVPAVDWRGSVWTFTQAFSGDLWASIFGLGCAASLAFLFLEGGRAGHQAFSISTWDSREKFLGDYFRSLYFCFGTFPGVGSWRPHTTAGKVVSAFWSLVVVIITSSYVASSAAGLLVGASATLSDKFDDFVNPSLRVCVLGGSAYSNFLANHETYRYLTQVPVAGGLRPMVEKLIAGECEGIVERKMHLEYVERDAGMQALSAKGGYSLELT